MNMIPMGSNPAQISMNRSVVIGYLLNPYFSAADCRRARATSTISIDDHSACEIGDRAGHSTGLVGGEERCRVCDLCEGAGAFPVRHPFDDGQELLPRD